MTGFLRLLTLLALAGAFLLASFLGSMTHSILAQLTREGRPWWAWGVGTVVVCGIAWVAFRALRRRAGRVDPDPPKT